MKVLFLQEYIRHSYVSEAGGKPKVVYKQTDMGKKLTKLLKRIGMGARDYMVDFDYDMIPEPKKIDQKTGRVFSYKVPTLKMRKEPEARLLARLLEHRPDIIIPMGEMGCKNLLGITSITKARGVPKKVKLADDYEPWVLPMFSMEFLTMNPNIENMVTADIDTLGRYVKDGDAGFEARKVEYEYADKFERVKQIFDFLYRFKPLTAWDLETNALRAEMRGAKPLVASFSWCEGQGVTIPLEHRESPWTKEELEQIYGLLDRFVADARQVKVGHNLQFDVRFLMGTKGFKEFHNNRDTLIAYYLIVAQKIETSKTLSDIAYELTDMGGYDQALEDFKRKYKKDYIDQKAKEIEQAKVEAKKQLEEEHKQAMVEYKIKMAEAKKARASTRGIVKPSKGKMPKFPAKSSIKLVNDIDGGNFNYEWIPLELLHPYASGDVDCCLRIHNVLEARIKPNPRMYDLWVKFYPNLTRALAHLEATGIMVDEAYAKVIEEEYTKEEQRILEQLRKFPAVQQLEEEHLLLYQAGLEEMKKKPADRDPEIKKLRDKYKKEGHLFKASSGDHKGKVLYKIMGITLPYNKELIKEKPFDDNVPENELTWADYKTDKHALGYIIEYVPEAKELATMLLEYSKVNTLKNNFAKKLPAMVSNKDGKVHGSFKITGTETSRLSSKDPNMQQIPRKVGDPNRFDYQFPIKRLFKTSFENGALIQLDYSALEMRILALVAGDEAMTQAFMNDEDVHKATASLVWGVPVEEVPDDMRTDAKAVNFGIAYGETPFSFAPKYDKTVEEAEEIFESYFANKPKIKDFIEETHEFVQKNGYVDTLQGHRRLIRDAFSRERNIFNGALRKSVNTIIQGTGAYLTNMSLVYIDDYLRTHNMKSRIALTVHDSIVIDCPKDEVDEVAKVATFIMENLPIDFLFIDWNGERVRFPIKADCEIGENYNDMVGYDKEELAQFASLKGYVKYHKDQKKVKDHKNANLLEPEKAEQIIDQLKACKEQYKQIA